MARVLRERLAEERQTDAWKVLHPNGGGPALISYNQATVAANLTFYELVRVVLPLSRPVLAVVSIFAVVAAWKDFIWPLLVFPDPAKQTLSVALQRFAPDTPINLLLAGLVLASLPMVALFLAFQRHILAGLTAGGVKG